MSAAPLVEGTSGSRPASAGDPPMAIFAAPHVLHARGREKGDTMKGTQAKRLIAAITSFALALTPLVTADAGDRADKLEKINHIVVIYQENHSFDNLYVGWEGVRGLADAYPAHTQQVSQDGLAYDCLLQDDVNLTSPPLLPICANTQGGVFTSAFVNASFLIDT